MTRTNNPIARLGLHVLCLFLARATAAELPNILWITSEDNGANWLGCYGNAEASTPRLDALAAGGLRFTHAYSNAPVCAVARSTILNGAYAVTQGTQHMRGRPAIPATFKPYVSYLRDQGYYCTNSSKTDYNFKGNDAAIWDQCSGKAHYNNRPEGKPFFAVFNLTVSHESGLFPEVVRKNRKNGIIPAKPRLDPSKLFVPPCVPDLPEMREDIAIYHDNISAMDRQAGELLDELRRRSLADDTIVFYYSDHGGAIARSKRYLQDTGTRVPMILHIPEKWKQLSPFKQGDAVDEPVSFVDLAPTLLSIAGLERPAQMQGRAFLGEHRVAPPADPAVFLFADRFDDIDGMRRGITDGRYKYIHTFNPHQPAAPYSGYSFGQPSWTAWRKAWQEGKLSGLHREIWESPQPVEMLFDTASDPWEVRNLAASPDQQERLAAMRGRLMRIMIETRDTGVVPEAMWPDFARGTTIHDAVRSPSFDHAAVVKLAFAATASGPREAMVKALSSESPVERYWAASGCLFMAPEAASANEQLTGLLEDQSAAVRIIAARALIANGEEGRGREALVKELDRTRGEAMARLLATSIEQGRAEDFIPEAWIQATRKNPKTPAPLKQLAKRLAKN